MSSSYTYTLYIALRDDLSPVECAALDYLFNDGPCPAQWPAHAFFQEGGVPERLGRQEGFPAGAFVSAFWRAADHPGMFSGVHYACPNLKMEWFYEVHLALAGWLASLSSARGHVGAFKNQDDDAGLPLLLYVYDRTLYLQVLERGVELLSADTGEAYAWPEAAN